jgi:IS30 family transposase
MEYVDERRIISKLMRDDGMTFKEIANFLKKDHSTIINHIQKHETDIKYVPAYRHKYEAVVKRLGREEV